MYQVDVSDDELAKYCKAESKSADGVGEYQLA